MFNFTPTKIDLALGAIILSALVIGWYQHRKPRASVASSNNQLGISELVNRVKSELIQAAHDSSNETAMFEVKSFDLEINFVVTDRQTQSGGFEAKVVTLGDELETSAQKTQKITLHMTAVSQSIHQDENAEPVDLQKPKRE